MDEAQLSAAILHAKGAVKALKDVHDTLSALKAAAHADGLCTDDAFSVHIEVVGLAANMLKGAEEGLKRLESDLEALTSADIVFSWRAYDGPNYLGIVRAADETEAKAHATYIVTQRGHAIYEDEIRVEQVGG